MTKTTGSTKEKEQHRLEGHYDKMFRWLASMPLSAGGHERNAQYIHDFALLLSHLGCQANSRILEIGSGSCWAVEWLARLGFRATAMDINPDMLKVGTERFTSLRRAFPETVTAESFVAGDSEFLPFADGSFDAVLCLNALHHVPDTTLVLREVHRILKPGGRFLFSEPGEGHSQTPESKREMEELGVLEKDMVIADIAAWATSAGFADMYLLPDFDPRTKLSIPDWNGLSKSWWRRPFLVLRWRKALDSWIRNHPTMVLIKGGGQADRATPAGEIVSVSAPDKVDAGGMFRVRARVKNTGRVAWQCWKSFLDSNPLDQGEGGYVSLGLKLRKADKSGTDMDIARGHFERDVEPGDEVDVACLAKAPPAGEYRLKADLVQEGVAWFEDRKGKPFEAAFSVRTPAQPVYPDSRMPDTLKADIVVKNPADLKSGEVRVSVKNSGTTIWLKDPKDEPGIPSYNRGYVRLGIQLLDSSRTLINRDFQRAAIDRDIAPGQQVELSFRLDTSLLPPNAAFVRFDMVDEHIAWFESHNSPMPVFPLA